MTTQTLDAPCIDTTIARATEPELPIAGARSKPARTAVEISVVFPAFNEEENIQRTVLQAREFLNDLTPYWEIIVVNDGSSDHTGRICDELSLQFPKVRTVHHPVNRGYGAAVKSGIEAARRELIFFSDSDGQFDLHDLLKLLPHVDRYDIVAGYRARRSDPWNRILNAWAWNLLVKLVLGIRSRDIDCAFKVFHRRAFERIQIRSDGALINTEIFAQAARLGLTVKEVPVRHFPREFGQQTGAGLRVILKAFRELFSLWRSLRRVSPDQPGLFRRHSIEPDLELIV